MIAPRVGKSQQGGVDKGNQADPLDIMSFILSV